MKKTIINFLIVIIAIAVGIFLYTSPREARAPDTGSVSNEVDTAIRTQVVTFGSKLKNVSLLMSPADVKNQMQEHYGSFLTPELLSKWQSNPAAAIGRKTSSPWPDRIDVVSVTEINENTYNVEGNVIEMTNADTPPVPAAVYPVSLQVENKNGIWLISALTKGAYSELPQRITVEGFWECLPHKNTSGPQTMECAFGIAVDQSDGHFAVDTRLMSTYPVDFPTGTKVRVTGVMTPANHLSSDMWQKYPIDGIISATSIEKI
jgi:hypothetical protein